MERENSAIGGVPRSEIDACYERLWFGPRPVHVSCFTEHSFWRFCKIEFWPKDYKPAEIENLYRHLFGSWYWEK